MRPRARLTGLFLAMTALGIFAGVSVPRPPRRERPGLNVASLPVCKEGEFLIYRFGNVGCEALPASTIPWPDCTGKLVTVRQTGDVSQLSCVDKGGGR